MNYIYMREWRIKRTAKISFIDIIFIDSLTDIAP